MSNHYASLVVGVDDNGERKEVRSPYDDRVIGTVGTVDEDRC